MRALSTKKELIDDMRNCTGCNGYITEAQIAKYTGLSRNNKEKLTRLEAGCRYEETGRGRKYLTADVAQNIINTSTYQF